MAQTMNISSQQALSGTALLRPTRAQKPFVARQRVVVAAAQQVGACVIWSSHRNQCFLRRVAHLWALPPVSMHFCIANTQSCNGRGDSSAALADPVSR